MDQHPKHISRESLINALENIMGAHLESNIAIERLNKISIAAFFKAVSNKSTAKTDENAVSQKDDNIQDDIEQSNPSGFAGIQTESCVLDQTQQNDEKLLSLEILSVINETNSRLENEKSKRISNEEKILDNSNENQKDKYHYNPDIRSNDASLSSSRQSENSKNDQQTPYQSFRHIQADAVPADDEIPASWGRYNIHGEVARGGQGRILDAVDDILGRPVALKILRKDNLADTRQVQRFYEEAQVNGQLEHPNIVPVYEFAWLPNGIPYYTMKKIEGRTLKRVIQGLRKGIPQIKENYGRIKLITILQQVCQAISFAHDRGVIHRDLKPANIMLGDYGEVIVLDWGVARVRGVDDSAVSNGQRPVRILRHEHNDTQIGIVEGTPAYMSPEQAKGQIKDINERSDVYALGAILYEILTYRPPFRAKDVFEVLRQVIEEEPQPPSLVNPENQIPQELEDICMKCLSKSAKDRYPSVKVLHAELEQFLEGTKRRFASSQKVSEARFLLKQHEDLKRELLIAKMVAKRAAEGIQGWEPVERKRGVWVTRNRVLDIEAKIVLTFGEAVAKFSQALAHEPENKDAQEGLADLFMNHLKTSETEGKYAEMVYSESMVRQYHGGKYTSFLQGDGFLSLDTNPSRAEVWLYRYEERDRILRPVDAKCLGYAPIREYKLKRGSYLLVLRLAGMRDVYYPVRLGRQEKWAATINLYPHEHIGSGFAYIPGGPSLLGGDVESIDPFEQGIVHVQDFAIQEFPVTIREYIEFLNAWLAVDQETAESHVPYLESDLPLVWLSENGYIPNPDLIGQETRAIGRLEMEYDIPVFGIDYEDAEAFCAWLTDITGREHRLPLENEWEKAARGVDGRIFPWGNQFDPTFCKSRLSRPWSPEPEPIGTFPEDMSPCGVRDMAGGVREWCNGWFNEAQGLRALRGGAWVDTERYMRCASRSFYDPYLNKRIAGFRCARSLSS